jgi:hypothetical protein
MRKLTKLYYQLTGWIPRPLPTDQESYEKMKVILKDAYGVPDELQVWGLLSGLITSTPPHRLSKSYQRIANCCHRLSINKLAVENKAKVMEAMQKQLEDKIRAEAEKEESEVEAKAEADIKLEATEKKEASDEECDHLH